MELVRNDTYIELKHDGKLIETYKMDEAIDFKKLVTFLLGDEMQTIFDLEDLIDNPTSAEKDLIDLIKEIIGTYNLKKVEMDDFISSQV